MLTKEEAEIILHPPRYSTEAWRQAVRKAQALGVEFMFEGTLSVSSWFDSPGVYTVTPESMKTLDDVTLTFDLNKQGLSPKEIAQKAQDNGHVPVFLKALCELLMCADPWPASRENEVVVKNKADVMARELGFHDWIEAYHGL